MTRVLERAVDTVTPASLDLPIFSAFDVSLDAACEAARASNGPILIVGSSRLDGTPTCSEH